MTYLLITGFVKSRITPTEPRRETVFIFGKCHSEVRKVLLQLLGVNLVVDGRALVDDQMFS
jgi:hypothetical protein